MTHLFHQSFVRNLQGCTFRDITQLEGPIRQTDQPVHFQPQCAKYPFDFPVLAFGELHGDPDVVTLLSVQRGFDRGIFDAVNLNTVLQCIKILLSDTTICTNTVPACPSCLGQLKGPGQFTIVGEQQQAFGVVIKPTNGNNARHAFRQPVKNSDAALRIFVRCHTAARLVETPQASGLMGRNNLSVHDNFFMPRHFERRRRQDPVINRDPPVFNQLFGIPPRANARPRKIFCDSLTFNAVSVFILIRGRVGGVFGSF